MRKFARFAAGVALVTLLVPSLALAHGGRGNGDDDDEGGDDGRGRGFLHIGGNVGWRFHRARTGTVNSVGSSSFQMTVKDGTVFTVNVPDADIVNAFGVTIQLADIQVNSRAVVKGSVEGTTIDASKVLITPPDTHPAAARGAVTAVSGNNFTIESQHHGVEYSVNVTTDSNTQFQTGGGTTTASGTIADVQVGAKVKIRGLWDEILNILRAIKVRIK